MAEKSIELDSVEIAAAVFGNCDRNIRLLEKEFSVTAVCRGTQLRISGEAANVAAATRAIEGMLLLIENHTPLEEQTVRYCLSLAHDGEEKRVKELTEDFVTVTVKGRPIRPKTLGQKEYLNAIRRNAVTFGVGPAGTGELSKLVNQLIVASTIATVAEGLLLAERGGADPSKVHEALMGGFVDSPIWRQHGQRMLDNDFTPGGPAKWQLKDTRTALAHAQKLGLTLPVGLRVDGLFQAMIEAGDGELDHAGLIRQLRRHNQLPE